MNRAVSRPTVRSSAATVSSVRTIGAVSASVSGLVAARPAMLRMRGRRRGFHEPVCIGRAIMRFRLRQVDGTLLGRLVVEILELGWELSNEPVDQ